MNTPLFIAHRGYSRFEKENTLVAFSAAGAIKEFYGIETDVHVTKDNHYVLIHDHNTKRVTSDLIDVNVETSTFDVVKEINLSDVDNSRIRNDLKIPEMINYFKICKKYNKVAIFELKQVFSIEQLKEIISIIESVGMLENTIFISFHLQALINLREISKTQKAQYLLEKFHDDTIEVLKKYNLALDIYYINLSKEQIDLCHQNNILVNIWTVDDINIAKQYASWGVDFITSNWISKLD